MNNLKILRKRKDVSQQEIADYLGVSRSAYGFYESGARNISTDLLAKLADYFGVSTDAILGREEQEPFGRQIVVQPVPEDDPENYVFYSTAHIRNYPLNRNAVDHLLRRLGKKVGIQNCGAHRFRHTFAIQYLRNGGDIYTLKRLIGHSSLRMVQRYLQLSEADSQAAHRKASPVDNWL